MASHRDLTDESALDTLFGVLASTTRRELLRYIDGESQPVPVSRLAAALGPDRRQTAIELHHTHLPRLSEAGLVEWDRDRGTVRGVPVPAIPPRDVSVLAGGQSVLVSARVESDNPDRRLT